MDEFKADFVDDLIKNISEDIENIDGVIISDYAKGML